MNRTTGTEEPFNHPSLLTKIPGVLLEEDVEGIVEAIVETPGPTLGERLEAAR